METLPNIWEGATNYFDIGNERPGSFPSAALMRIITRGKHPWTMTDTWHTDVKEINWAGDLKGLHILYMNSSTDRINQSLLIQHGHEYASLHVWATELAIQVISSEGLEGCKKLIEKVREVFKVSKQPDSDHINVQFWFGSRMGEGKSFQRTLLAPPWDTIENNYAHETRAGLDALMNFNPTSPGQLILWSGDPGTGKTFALRALALAWRKWCRMDVIMDPEMFLGDAQYLASNLLSTVSSSAPHPWEVEDEEGGQQQKQDWRLIVLEDAGELITADAKSSTGQGLSRLLNITDGLLGQGLQLLILITTNENLGKLHPAIIRPGRCASSLDFKALSRAEAKSWYNLQGIDKEVKQKNILAELYESVIEKQYGRDLIDAGVGFAANAQHPSPN